MYSLRVSGRLVEAIHNFNFLVIAITTLVTHVYWILSIKDLEAQNTITYQFYDKATPPMHVFLFIVKSWILREVNNTVVITMHDMIFLFLIGCSTIK